MTRSSGSPVPAGVGIYTRAQSTSDCARKYGNLPELGNLDGGESR